MYCLVAQCTVRYGGVLCGRAVQCVVGLCKVCQIGVMCVRVVYCFVGRYTAY